MVVDYSILNHSPFNTLTNDAARMKVKKGFRRISIEPYTLMAKQNCTMNQIGYICSGSLLYFSVAENGNIIRKGIAETGNYFGLEGLLFDKGKAMFDILAMTRLECLVIEKQAFVDILKESDRLNIFFKALARKTIHRDFSGALSLRAEGNESEALKQELRIDKSIDFINANYTDQITLDQLAG
ncbi:MAG: cyclic nucleotide-binding domain-containing protein, partial [Desulfobacterales bacterium]|nr:cyclic nucleotide-binding domain-containing protein [Desulfobacterales bacterium]